MSTIYLVPRKRPVLDSGRELGEADLLTTLANDVRVMLAIKMSNAEARLDGVFADRELRSAKHLCERLEIPFIRVASARRGGVAAALRKFLEEQPDRRALVGTTWTQGHFIARLLMSTGIEVHVWDDSISAFLTLVDAVTNR